MNKEEFYNSLNEPEKEIFNYLNDPTSKGGLQLLMTCKDIYEIGSGWGIFTRSVLEGKDWIRIKTIDKQENLELFEKNVRGFSKQITRVFGDSKVALQKENDESYDLVYVDGDHSHKGFVEDFRQAWRICKKRGWILCDDIFHKNNWVPEKDYGTCIGLGEMIKEKGVHAWMLPVAHGWALIQKPE